MQIKGSHLGFYVDFMVIFKTGGRNEFLTPKYPRIEVLFMIVAPEDQFHIETHSAYLLIYIIHSICSITKSKKLLKWQLSLICLFSNSE